MPRLYCHYCKAYVTHDTTKSRRDHDKGYKHKSNRINHFKDHIERLVNSGFHGPDGTYHDPNPSSRSLKSYKNPGHKVLIQPENPKTGLLGDSPQTNSSFSSKKKNHVPLWANKKRGKRSNQYSNLDPNSEWNKDPDSTDISRHPNFAHLISLSSTSAGSNQSQKPLNDDSILGSGENSLLMASQSNYTLYSTDNPTNRPLLQVNHPSISATAPGLLTIPNVSSQTQERSLLGDGQRFQQSNSPMNPSIHSPMNPSMNPPMSGGILGDRPNM